MPLLGVWYDEFLANSGSALRRYQQNDTHFTYMGPWSGAWTPVASSGSFRYVNAPGSAVNVTFDGTYLAWVAKKSKTSGKAWVRVDSDAPVLVDLYSPNNEYKKRVWNTGLLTDGPHSVSIYWTGQKNPAATGTYVNVDAFDVMGDLSDGSEPAPVEWRYQQTEPKFTRLGSWSTAYAAAASGGSLYYTSAPGAGIVASFTGTSVKVIAKTSSSCGEAVVTLDGSDTTVDFWSATPSFGQVVFEREGLSPGAHTLSVRCIGTLESGTHRHQHKCRRPRHHRVSDTGPHACPQGAE